jgi:hypothetical protein
MAEVVFPSADWMIAAKDAVNASEGFKMVQNGLFTRSRLGR